MLTNGGSDWSSETNLCNTKMNKMCLAHLAVFLLALHLLSSQVVQAQNMTDTTTGNMTMSNSTMTPTVLVNVTSKENNGCGSVDAFTLLLPLAVAASLLHGWSQ